MYSRHGSLLLFAEGELLLRGIVHSCSRCSLFIRSCSIKLASRFHFCIKNSSSAAASSRELLALTVALSTTFVAFMVMYEKQYFRHDFGPQLTAYIPFTFFWDDLLNSNDGRSTIGVDQILFSRVKLIVAQLHPVTVMNAWSDEVPKIYRKWSLTEASSAQQQHWLKGEKRSPAHQVLYVPQIIRTQTNEEKQRRNRQNGREAWHLVTMLLL